MRSGKLLCCGILPHQPSGNFAYEYRCDNMSHYIAVIFSSDEKFSDQKLPKSRFSTTPLTSSIMCLKHCYLFTVLIQFDHCILWGGGSDFLFKYNLALPTPKKLVGVYRKLSRQEEGLFPLCACHVFHSDAFASQSR